ncbi:MAG: tetratricopeptide repeat protein [Desulfarculus sp.]|nr:tetratricopeptide repeat protein [Pseudomonadota bacterium]MBV1714754.1 tetratricopeptide repeat protein [Desulfarculus sp.]MBU4575084.1 tetratricopeptide repeat protein [Pseudomonadota bacterium]MBU4600295.1 tetratricopeptide repeat protein [Pseudomonadota bacterium]MBV1740242.1 tetratricopeptide repeat protein [Desulfarculus sp.]
MGLALVWACLSLAPFPALAQGTDKDLDPGVKLNYLIMEGDYFRIEPEQYLREGIQASITDNYRRAVYLLSKAIDSGGLTLGDLSRAYVARGVSYQGMGKLNEAVHDFAKALEAMPSSPTAHYHLANVLKDKKKTTEAIIALNQAITLKPNYAQAYLLRGRIWMQRGDYNLAAKDFSQCIAHDSSIGRAFYERGQALRKMGKINDALADFKEFSLRNPLDSQVKQLIIKLEYELKAKKG